MARIVEVLFLVLTQTAAGGTFLMTLKNFEPVGVTFYRTNGFVLLLLAAAGLWTMPRPLGPHLILFPLFAGLLLATNVLLWRNPRQAGKLQDGQLRIWQVTGWIGAAAVTVSALAYAKEAGSAPLALLVVASFLIGSLLLGSTLLGMLTGHAYLTRPTLPIEPLKTVSSIFFKLTALQALIVAADLALAGSAHSRERLADALLIRSFEGVYLWSRLLIGTAAPLLLAWMTLKTVEERATMSATGLLYIAMVMVVVGQIFSRYFLVVRSIFI